MRHWGRRPWSAEVDRNILPPPPSKTHPERALTAVYMSRYMQRDKQRSERAPRFVVEVTHTHTHTIQRYTLLKHWKMNGETDVRVILLRFMQNIYAQTHTHCSVFSSFSPQRRRGRHFNCSSEEMASFHLDEHIMSIFHFELSFTYRVSQLFSLWTPRAPPCAPPFFWHFSLWFCQNDLHSKFVPLLKK